MEFGTDLWEATQKSAPERTGDQWRALAGAVFGLLKGDRERAVAEIRVLRVVLEGRAGDLGARAIWAPEAWACCAMRSRTASATRSGCIRP